METRLALASQLRTLLPLLRRAAGLTQHELGNRIGLSQRRIAQIETGPEAVSFERIHEILTVLGADVVVRTRDPDSSSVSPW
jgi:HTH-type transcriptional regulator/antitoxin HipB